MKFNEGLIFNKGRHLYIIKHEDSIYNAEYYYNGAVDGYAWYDITGSYFKTVEEAIKWCQKDYKGRVRSLLDE